MTKKGFLRWLWHMLIHFGRPERLYRDAMRAYEEKDYQRARLLVDEWLSLYGSEAK